MFSLNCIGFAFLERRLELPQVYSFLSASETDLSTLSAAITCLIWSGGSVKFLAWGSSPNGRRSVSGMHGVVVSGTPITAETRDEPDMWDGSHTFVVQQSNRAAARSRRSNHQTI